MRLIVICFGLLLGIQTASAFECVGVKLPSSIVICSDPELMRIADERQQAFGEARARLTEQQFKALLANQNAWVRNYASQCGVPPDGTAPALPVPPSIQACFKAAGEARTAYIRSYGVAPGITSSELQSAGRGVAQVLLAEENGVYKVPVLINGVLTLQFTVDSGASDVSIPADVYLTLIRTGTIKESDWLGKTKFRLADGSVQENGQFVIHELRVGSRVLHEVTASVGEIRSLLLLGQSFFKRFSSVSIDNDRHTLSLGEERPRAPAAFNGPSLLSMSPPSQAGTGLSPVPRGRIGVSMQDLTGELVELSDVLEGAAIARVEPGGPADRAGIQVGDIVTAVNGVSVRRGTDLQDQILRAEVGRSAYLTVVRRRNLLQVPVLVERAQ